MFVFSVLRTCDLLKNLVLACLETFAGTGFHYPTTNSVAIFSVQNGVFTIFGYALIPKMSRAVLPVATSAGLGRVMCQILSGNFST